MSNIFTYETQDLDLKECIKLKTSCQQLDTIVLSFNIYNYDIPVDLTNFNIEFRAVKSDGTFYSQVGNITKVGNLLTITCNNQLTVVNGKTVGTLRIFDNENNQKSSYFIVLNISGIVSDDDRVVSRNFVDILEHFDEDINIAMKLSTTFASDITEADKVNDTLVNTITTGNGLNSNLTTQNNNATSNISNLTTQNTNATSNIATLTTQNNNATSNISNLTTQNTNASTNLANFEAIDTNNIVATLAIHSTQLSDIVTLKPSGDITGITDIQNINAELLAKKQVNLSDGIYYINETIDLTTGMSIIARNKEKTIIKTVSDIDAICLNGSDVDPVCDIEIKNISLDGNNVGLKGISFKYARENNINFCRANKFVTGLNMYQSWSNSIDTCDFSLNIDNIILDVNSNDVKITNCKMDSAINTGINVIGDASSISIIGGCIQSCGKDGIYAKCGRVITILGTYFEQNNTTGTLGCCDINLMGSVEKTILGALISATFFGILETSFINIDKARGINISGSSFNGVNPKRITTSLKSSNVFVIGGTSESTDNDLGSCIVDMSTPKFRNHGGVKCEGATWSCETPDASTKPSFVMKQGNIVKTQFVTETNGDLYLAHNNTSTSLLENVFRVSSSNVFQFYTPPNFTGNRAINFVLDQCSTASRPGTPFLNQIMIDVTINKIIRYDGANWRDVMGTIV